MLKYRHTSIEDLPKIAEWIAADPSHKDTFKAEDFVLVEEDGKLSKGIQCIEVFDDVGPIFYLRFKNALIVETQFPPNPGLRVAKGLKEALAFFSVSSKKLGYHAMFFNSVSEGLISFFEKLGFNKLKDYFKADL
jgi:hypothetical protein